MQLNFSTLQRTYIPAAKLNDNLYYTYYNQALVLRPQDLKPPRCKRTDRRVGTHCGLAISVLIIIFDFLVRKYPISSAIGYGLQSRGVELELKHNGIVLKNHGLAAAWWENGFLAYMFNFGYDDLAVAAVWLARCSDEPEPYLREQ